MRACLQFQVRPEPLADASVCELLQVGSAHEVGHVAQDANLHHGREAVRVAHFGLARRRVGVRVFGYTAGAVMYGSGLWPNRVCLPTK